MGGGTQDDIAQIYQGTEILLAAISGCAILVLLFLYQMIKMKKEILIRKMHWAVCRKDPVCIMRQHAI